MKTMNWYSIWTKDGKSFEIKSRNLKQAIKKSRVSQDNIIATRTGKCSKNYKWDGEKLEKI